MRQPLEKIAPEHFNRWVALLRDHGDEKKAAAVFVRELPEAERELVSQLAQGTTFTRRGYPGGVTYSWPMHPLFNIAPVDPWPAARYPRNVLLVDLALRLPASNQA